MPARRSCLETAYKLPQRFLIQPAIDADNFLHPPLALTMLHIHNVQARPVKMVGNIGYLLMQAVEGVAYDPPKSAKSSSMSALQSGHLTVITLEPCSLIWR